AKQMPKVFALFTAGSLASLALPGMSGFVSELTIFLGITSSDVYSTSFKVVVVFLAAVGLILTPIYLLSMLREVFYGKSDTQLSLDPLGIDAKPREIFIALCLIIPVMGIGFYPKLATTTYDVKTVAVAAKVRDALPLFAERKASQSVGSLPLNAPALVAPPLSNSEAMMD
ncbi:MAG: NAD(P)H-quinone oxidoreductase subunit 4, partial [Kamptonema sp. SIO4C4]|nr:NAD(P)H-quinone oxidoreductase subunit 4 [Kamptonema sp. SIO4C4]